MMKLFFYAATALVFSVHVTSGQECPALAKDKEDGLLRYVKERYSFPPSAHVSLVTNTVFDGTCYRKLIISSDNPARTFPMYLSPDQRFLSPVLFDTAVDPAIERKVKIAETAGMLSQGDSPFRGERTRPVTIVEFSDFQCPYCRRFSQLFDSLPPSLKEKVRLEFRELPLEMHKWARTAAELAVCTSQQGNDPFWKANQFFFQNQTSLTADNVVERFFKFVEEDGHIDQAAIQSCVSGKGADPILARDSTLAAFLRVTGTPTLFINGQRSPGIRNTDELIAAINAEADQQVSRETPSLERPQ